MADLTHPAPRSALPGRRLQAYRSRVARLGAVARAVLKNPPTLIGAIVIVLMLGMAAFAPLLVAPNSPDPYQMPRDWAAINVPPGSPGHLLGTDPTGGDVLYGLVWGARTSLRLAITVVAATLVIGIAVGSAAGFIGGKVDGFLMRVVDVVMAVPKMILALAIAGMLGPSFTNIMLALIVSGWTWFARLVRAEILRVKQEEYVDAARVMGDSRWRIYLKDVLPNSLTPVVVAATLEMGHVVIIGATLSFIGLAEAGLAEWGVLVSAGQEVMLGGKWWASTFGGLMVFLWALSFNLVGDGLRDILDPRTEGR
jgi:peptide/nickel transport system permease protein